jgi:hypothetical protein
VELPWIFPAEGLVDILESVHGGVGERVAGDCVDGGGD